MLSLLRSSSCSDLRGRFRVTILLSSGSWSGKFPIERSYLWGCKSVSAVGVACPACAVLCMRARRDSQLVRAVPDSTEFLLDVTSWAVLRLSLLTDCWTILIRLCSGPPASGPVVSFSWVFLLVGCCLFRVWGFPPPVNVVNRANQMDRFCMPIWSFYCKTNIVILTCPSDMFPPVLPTFAFS